MRSNVSNFPAPGRKIQESNADPQSLQLHPGAKLIFDAYFGCGSVESGEVNEACERLEVPTDVECSRLEAAVAQVLLHSVQYRLPQWSCWNGTRLVFARPYRSRPQGQALAFVPQHLFTINWADSGPGFSWPEAYHLTFVPGYERWVVTASRDCADAWGCTDNAIGHFSGGGNRVARAGSFIRARWNAQRDYDQTPWCYLFDEGLVSTRTADQWRSRVWTKAELNPF